MEKNELSIVTELPGGTSRSELREIKAQIYEA